jgi:hypothetical protein
MVNNVNMRKRAGDLICFAINVSLLVAFLLAGLLGVATLGVLDSLSWYILVSTAVFGPLLHLLLTRFWSGAPSASPSLFQNTFSNKSGIQFVYIVGLLLICLSLGDFLRTLPSRAFQNSTLKCGLTGLLMLATITVLTRLRIGVMEPSETNAKEVPSRGERLMRNVLRRVYEVWRDLRM